MLKKLEELYLEIRRMETLADKLYEDLEFLADELARTIHAEEDRLANLKTSVTSAEEEPSKDIHYEYGDRIKLRDLRVSEIADSLIDYHEIYTEHYGKKALFLRYEDEGTLALVLFNTNFSRIPVFLIEHL